LAVGLSQGSAKGDLVTRLDESKGDRDMNEEASQAISEAIASRAWDVVVTARGVYREAGRVKDEAENAWKAAYNDYAARVKVTV